MLPRIIKQQNALNRSFLKVFVICSFIALVLGLSSYQNLCYGEHIIGNLMNTIFPRYLVFCILVPTFLLTVLATLRIYLVDIYYFQSRSILIYQTLYRIFFTTLLMISFWVNGNLIAIFFSGYGELLGSVWVQIFVRLLYLWLACDLLALICSSVYFVTQRKLVSFLFGFGINTASFGLAISHHSSLFYDFDIPNYRIILFMKIPILTGLILLAIVLLSTVIKRCDL